MILRLLFSCSLANTRNSQPDSQTNKHECKQTSQTETETAVGQTAKMEQVQWNRIECLELRNFRSNKQANDRREFCLAIQSSRAQKFPLASLSG